MILAESVKVWLRRGTEGTDRSNLSCVGGGGRSVWITSRHIWGLAREAAERSRAAIAGGDALPADAWVAIILAATSTDAFIDELGKLLALRRDMDASESMPLRWLTLPDVLEELEKAHASTHVKYLMASQVLSRSMFPKGEAPFQNFSTLLKVRNLLIHPRGEYAFDEQYEMQLPRIIVDLAQRGLARKARPRVRENPLHLVRTDKMALWACDSARQIVLATLAMVPRPSQDREDPAWELRLQWIKDASVTGGES